MVVLALAWLSVDITTDLVLSRSSIMGSVSSLDRGMSLLVLGVRRGAYVRWREDGLDYSSLVILAVSFESLLPGLVSLP